MRRLLFAIAGAMATLVSSPVAAEDARWSFPQQYSVSPKGVNMQTGRFAYSKTDIAIGNLKFTRNWGDTPAVAPSARSLGLLGTYSQDYIPHWVPPNSGWNHNFNQGVQFWPGSDSESPREYVVVDGKLNTFGELADGGIVPADPGTQGTRLTWSNSQWTFTDRSGAMFVFFDPTNTGSRVQLLQSATYADGSRIDYTYASGGKPRVMKSNRGYAIVLDYDGNGNVSAACGFNLAQTYVDASTTCASATLKASYGYNGTGALLTSVTDTMGRVTTITYSTSSTGFSAPACISRPNASTCEIQNSYGYSASSTFNFDDQVNTQTTATGGIWRYSFIPQPDPLDVPPGIGQPRYSHGSMVDAVGGGYGMKYDRGRLIEQATPSGTIQYRYPYQQYTMWYGPAPIARERFDPSPGLVTLPEGNAEFFGHDNRGNVTLHSYWTKGSANPAAPSDPNLQNCCINWGTPTMPANSVSYAQTFLSDEGVVSYYGYIFIYGCGSGPADAKLCDKPLTRTDANGNVTDYTYAQAHGGVLTETGPAVNGVRPQTRYTYAQRTAWIKTSGGAYTAASPPVWVLTEKSTCKTGAAATSGTGCALGASDEVRTTYDYGPDNGPNNLLLRGTVDDAGGLALRTCYTYDQYGNKVSETKPRAGLTSCP